MASQVPEPEAIYVGSMDPQELAGVDNLASVVASSLRLDHVPTIRLETASSSGAAVFTTAYAAVASGQYRRVLAVAGEKMTGQPTRQVTRVLAGVIHPEERQVGLTMPAVAALVTRCYRKRLRVAEGDLKEVLGKVAVKAHANGAYNTTAHFQKPITQAQYRESKPVAEPLQLFDCSPISDGAAAAVITAEATDIRVAGLGQGTDFVSLRKRQTLESFRATVRAAQKAYQMAGYGPDAVHFAEVHDAFTPFELLALQDLGLFPAEEVVAAIEEGRTTVHGALPVNPDGGLKAHGHPVGATGLAQIVEAVWQMRGQVDPRRQVPRTGVALTHSIGGPGSNNFVVLLERADAHPVPVPAGEVVAPNEWVSPTAEQRPDPSPDSPPTRGRLETFTRLHVTPEDIPAPAVLGLITVRDGARVLARGQPEERYRLGEMVQLGRRGEVPLFRKTSRLFRPLIGVTLRAGRLVRMLRRRNN